MIGYDEVVKVDTNHAEYVAPLTIEALREARRRSPSSCRSASSRPTATSSRPTSVRDALYSLPPANLPDTPRRARDMAAFKASARSLDQGVGAVLDALDDLGLADEHAGDLHHRPRARLPRREGDALRPRDRGDADHARARAASPAARSSTRSSRHLDVYPTLCELAGVERAGLAAGRLAAAAGRAARSSDCTRRSSPRSTYHAAYEPQRAVRTERCKYIRRFGDCRAPGARQLRRQPQQGPAARGTAGATRDRRPRSSSTTSSSTPTRRDNLAADPAHARCSRSCAGGSTPGCARPTTRCSTGRCRAAAGGDRQRAVAGLARRSRPGSSRRIPRPLPSS